MNLDQLRIWIVARCNASERGANLVEYILIVAIIAVILIIAIGVFGGVLDSKYRTQADSVVNAQ